MHNVWTWAPFEEGVMVAFTGYDGRHRTMVMPRLTGAQFEVRLAMWRKGMNIQDAFPMLNADQREFLMTGITPRGGKRAMSLRAERAEKALHHLRFCGVEHRRQAYDEWLGVATPGEVRRHWRQWMGKFPSWAEHESARIKEGKK